MLRLYALRHAYPEGAGFLIDRKHGFQTYTFLHFFDPVEIRLGGTRVLTEPHACLLYDIGTPQYYRSDTGFVHDWIHFTGEAAALLRAADVPLDRIFYPSAPSFITPLVREMESESYADRRGSDLLTDAKLTELFVKLGRACHGENVLAVDRGTKERFRALRGEVLSSLAEHWTVEGMAKRVNLSPSRFHATYKALFGSSPMDDIIRARVDTAKNALAFSDADVRQIAEDLGYGNLSHFCRQFRTVCGVPPGQYRKQNR